MQTLKLFGCSALLVSVLATGGCMAAGWSGGRGPDPSVRIDYQVEVNFRKIRISVPAGGKSAAPTDLGPLIVPRTSSPNFKARSLFARQYGKSTTLGREFGDFKISLDVVSVPEKMGNVPENKDDLVDFIRKGVETSWEVRLERVGEMDWAVRESPRSIFGYTFLYTRRLDDDALVSLVFALDRNRMQSDPVWLEVRKRDIDAVLRSFVEE
ncbi:hypothetical protein [Dokdonella sp.]|uniref:hypothetical protein n=1 Tax=Dokdonella sp. TaxID=2291710 RepID=UPI0025B8490D|nr:hypothetical protein [Dokdonella sp.]MBX3692643.1 hypothetical protein [Dokdonella sp.]